MASQYQPISVNNIMLKLLKLIPYIGFVVAWAVLSWILLASLDLPSSVEYRAFGDSITLYSSSLLLPAFIGMIVGALLEEKIEAKFHKKSEKPGFFDRNRDGELLTYWLACFAIEVAYQILIWHIAPDFLRTTSDPFYIFLNSGIGLLIFYIAYAHSKRRKIATQQVHQIAPPRDSTYAERLSIDPIKGNFYVVVHENSSIMRREDHYFLKERFYDFPSAVKVCERIVDDHLNSYDLSSPDKIKEAYQSWFAFGEDPEVRPGHFSGADYLRLRCAEAYASWRRVEHGVLEEHVQINYPQFGLAILEVEGLPTVITLIDAYLRKCNDVQCETSVPNLPFRLIILECALKSGLQNQELLEYVRSYLMERDWEVR